MAEKIALAVEAIRRDSLVTARDMGLPTNESLPLLADVVSTRTADEIVDRLLCLNAVVMCACGFDRAKTHAWLNREKLIEKLASSERHFIGEDTGEGDMFLAGIESISTLMWIIGMDIHLFIERPSDPFRPHRVPNAETGEDSELFRTWVRPRSTIEIAAACDLAACVQWGIRQATLSHPKTLTGWTSAEQMEPRRRVLEWLLSDQPWQETPLDSSFGGERAAQPSRPEDADVAAQPVPFRESIRRRSLKTVSDLGYPINPGLPFAALESPKSKDEAVSRLLCLYAQAVRAEGIGLRKVRAWLSSEGLSKAQTRDERTFLEWSTRDPDPFTAFNVESIWTLAWALGLVEELDFGKDTGDELIDLLPDIKKGEGGAALRAKAALRPWEEILAACDVADCIHWAIREEHMKGWKPSGKVHPYALTERRRALKWLICGKAWNVVSLAS